MLQKYINGEAQEEYKQGELISETTFATLSECNEGNQKPDETIEGNLYQWIDSGRTGCLSGDKYTIEKEQMSIDGGETWTDTGNTRRGQLIQSDSTDCLQYRWVEVDNDYICVNGDKYTKDKQQVSNDDGETWEDTGVTRASTLFETGSSDCDYASKYLTFEALEDTKIYIAGGNARYSTDDGTTWTFIYAGDITPIFAKGTKIMWKATTTASD